MIALILSVPLPLPTLRGAANKLGDEFKARERSWLPRACGLELEEQLVIGRGMEAAHTPPSLPQRYRLLSLVMWVR